VSAALPPHKRVSPQEPEQLKEQLADFHLELARNDLVMKDKQTTFDFSVLSESM
jgi:uncharacterized protein (UPF0264 family)